LASQAQGAIAVHREDDCVRYYAIVNPENQTVAIEHEYVTDATFVPRLSRAHVSFVFSRPAMVVLVVFISVFGIFTLWLSIWGFDAGWFFGILLLLLIPYLALSIYSRTKRGNARRVPVGSRIAVGLGETSMRAEGPLGSDITSYRGFSHVYRRGDFVFLRLQGTQMVSILPIELFPGFDFEKLRDAVTRANA
jgi:hypothetical protein